MKTRFLTRSLLVLLTLGMAVLTSCSKDDDPTPAAPKEYRFLNPNTYTIPDDAFAEVASPITVSGIPQGAKINDILVSVQIGHSWVGDLSIWLIAPDGQTRVGLMDRPGVPAILQGSAAQLSVNNTYSFADSATASSEQMGEGSYSDIPSGSWHPSWDNELDPPAYNNFPGFISALPADVNGEWKLYIRDSSGDAAGGSFLNVQLVITAQQ